MLVSSLLSDGEFFSSSMFEPKLSIPFVSSRIQRAHGVVVSHPLSMRENQGSIPCVSIVFSSDVCATRACDTEAYIYIQTDREIEQDA